MTHEEIGPLPRKSPERSVVGLVLAVTAAAAAAFAVFVFLLARFGGPAIEQMPDRIAEIYMEEGLRLEKAGDVAGAVAAFDKALERRFTNPANRSNVLVHLGVLHVKRQEFDRAISRLQEALEDAEAPVSAYAHLVQALMGAGRFQEAADAAARWETRAKQQRLDDQAASAAAALEKARKQRAGSKQD